MGRATSLVKMVNESNKFSYIFIKESLNNINVSFNFVERFTEFNPFDIGTKPFGEFDNFKQLFSD